MSAYKFTPPMSKLVANDKNLNNLGMEDEALREEGKSGEGTEGNPEFEGY
jgi:hypothetical protein